MTECNKDIKIIESNLDCGILQIIQNSINNFLHFMKVRAIDSESVSSCMAGAEQLTQRGGGGVQPGGRGATGRPAGGAGPEAEEI